MTNSHDWPLYILWQDAGLKGYGLRLEGECIRLVPIRSQDMEQSKSFAWNDGGFEKAQAWLKTAPSQHKDETTQGGVES